MATGIIVNGTYRQTPGAYSEIDASGLESTNPGALGVVAVIGTATSGRPVTAIESLEDIIEISNPNDVRATFRAGDLREACAMAYDASSDPRIPSGPALIYAFRVNPATASSAVLSNSLGSSIEVTSQDWGAFTDQINIQVEAGTSGGRLVTVNFESTTEAFDNIGEDPIFDFVYEPPTSGNGGWTAMRLQVLENGLQAWGSRAVVGEAGELGAGGAAVASVPVTVTYTTGDNTGRVVTIYGIGTTGAFQREQVIIPATGTSVNTTASWTFVYGAHLDAAAATSSITIEEGTDDIFVFSVGQSERGMRQVTGCFVGNAIPYYSIDTAADADILIYGIGSTGAVATDRIQFSAAGVTRIRGTTTFTRIDSFIVAGMADARTVTVEAVAGQTTNDVQVSLQQAADYFNARRVGSVGFFMNLTGSPDRAVADTDLSANALADPSTNVYDTAVDFYGISADIVSVLNSQSGLVSAERIALTPLQYSLATTAANSATYTITVDGQAIAYTSDASATVAEIQAGLVAAANAHAGFSRRCTLEASGVALLLTARTGSSHSLTVGATAGALVATLVDSAAGVGTPPNNMTTAQFLAGGAEGTATQTEWNLALSWLERIRANIIVPLTGDPSVHAAVAAHCNYMAGVGRSERNARIGLSALDGNDEPTNVLPTRASIRAQIQALNNRYVDVSAQSIVRYNTAGVRTTFLPWFDAMLKAAMQAGSPLGTSLTNATRNVLSVIQDSSWDPASDSEAMISMGLNFTRRESDGTYRVVRDITSFIGSTNLAYQEVSVMESANFMAYDLRETVRTFIGQRGVRGIAAVIKGKVAARLGFYRDELGLITGYTGLNVVRSADIVTISLSPQVVVPINFISIPIYLTTSTEVA